MIRKAIRRLKFVRSYQRRFGPLTGLRVANAMADAGYRMVPGTEVTISIPEWHAPLLIRAQTSDPEVFRQVVVRRELELEFDVVPQRIIDAGANIGISVRVFAERWPEASIIAIDR